MAAKAAKGRRPLTAEDVQAKVRAYCDLYKVTELTPEGLPVFPSGQRETPQHRAWIVVYKAAQRLRRRQLSADPEARAAALAAQDGRCPVCREPVGADDPAVDLSPQRIVHRRCRDLLGAARALGPDALDRARRLLWPEGRPGGAGRRR